MGIDVRKRRIYILSAVLLLVVLLPSFTLCDEAWALLVSDPAENASLEQGDMVAYTLIIQIDVEEEQLLRIQTPQGVTLSESAFTYRTAEGTEGEYTSIWGNDGCVLSFPGFSKGDMLMFIARINELGEEPISCTVTWGEESLTLVHQPAASTNPEVSESAAPTAKPSPASAQQPQQEPEQDSAQSALPEQQAAAPASSPSELQSALKRRQGVALVISLLALIAICTGILLALRGPKNERKTADRAE